MREKLKSYKFWLAILGAMLIIVQNIAKAYDVVITDEVGYNIINVVCGALVFMGIIDKPNGKSNKDLTVFDDLDDMDDTGDSRALRDIQIDEIQVDEKTNVKNDIKTPSIKAIDEKAGTKPTKDETNIIK